MSTCPIHEGRRPPCSVCASLLPLILADVRADIAAWRTHKPRARAVIARKATARRIADKSINVWASPDAVVHKRRRAA